MDVADLRTAHSQRVHRFKELGDGLRVKRIAKDKVLVRTVIDKTKLDEVEKSGLYLPAGAKEAYTPLPSKGVVIEIGRLVTEYEVGDIVLFSKFAGTDFRCAEQDLRVIPEEEVLLTLEDTDNSVVQVEMENPL